MVHPDLLCITGDVIMNTQQDTRQQPMVNHGDLISLNNKRVLCEAEVNSYNQYTKDFNRLTYTAEKEFMLDQRHKFLVQCFNF